MNFATLNNIEDEAYLNDYSIKEYTECIKNEMLQWTKEHDWIYDIEKDDWVDIPEELQFTHVDLEFQIICKWIKYFLNYKEEQSI